MSESWLIYVKTQLQKMKKYKIQKNRRVSHNNESSEKYLKNKSKEGFALSINLLKHNKNKKTVSDK